MTEQPPPAEGWFAGLLHAAKGLNFTNVAVIALLAGLAIPLYFVYQVLNDPALLDRFLSSYRETATHTECVLREVRTRGGTNAWGLATGFAFFGNDKYQLSVIVPEKPDAAHIASYCETLLLTVDWMRSPTEHEVPKIMWQYPLEDGGFHREP